MKVLLLVICLSVLGSCSSTESKSGGSSNVASSLQAAPTLQTDSAVVIESSPITVAFVNVEYQYKVVTSGSNTGRLTTTVQGLPTSLNFNKSTNVISGVLTQAGARFNILISVNGGVGGAVTQAFELVVLDKNILAKTFPSQINLSWFNEGDADSGLYYNVYRKTLGTLNYPNVPIKTTSLRGLQDKGLPESTAYEYQIRKVVANVETPITGGDIAVSTTSRSFNIKVYEYAGENIAAYPVQAFIPLPYGVYNQAENQLKNKFKLVDANGANVAAQYYVKSRWYERDNSIKEIAVIFVAKNILANAGQGTLGAPGAANYYLVHGNSAVPNIPTTIVETAGAVAMSNEFLTVNINKLSFNLIDSVFYKGNSIINNVNSDGAYMVNRFNQLDIFSNPCSSLTPLVFQIEEAGPVRVRLRVERPATFVQNTTDTCFARYPGVQDPVPGFVVWFDLYAGSSELFVNFNILNNAISSYRSDLGAKGNGLNGWPLFFQESGFKFTYTLGASLKAQVTHNGGVQVFNNQSLNAIQSASNAFKINNTIVSTAGGRDISVQDTVSGLGFAMTDGFFYKTYPNEWKLDYVNSALTFKTAPDLCAECESFEKYESQDPANNVPNALIPSNSGLYAIDDLSIGEKRFVMTFFDTVGANNPTKRKNIHYLPPKAALSIDDYNALGSASDLFGIKSVLTPQLVTVDNNYALHSFATKQFFGIRMNRFRSCTTGNFPYTGMSYLVEYPPQINQLDVLMYDDLKRPQFLPRYWSGLNTATKFNAYSLGPDILNSPTTNGEFSAEFNTTSYCKYGPLRSYKYGQNVRDNADLSNPYFPNKVFPAGFGTPSIIKTFLNGSPVNTTVNNRFDKSMSPGPRDNAHLWNQQLYDAPVDNPLLDYFKRGYDAYLYAYGSHLIAKNQVDHVAYTTIRSSYDSVIFADINPRALGNTLIAMVDSLAENKDIAARNALKYSIESVLDTARILQLQYAQGGGNGSIHELLSKGGYVTSFQDGFFMHGVLNAMASVDKGSVIWNKGYALLMGSNDVNSTSPGLIDAILSNKFGQYELVNCEVEPANPVSNKIYCLGSNISSTSLVDPLVVLSLVVINDLDVNNKWANSKHKTKVIALTSHLIKYLDRVYGNGPASIDNDWKNNIWTGNLVGRTTGILSLMQNDTTARNWLNSMKHIEGDLLQ